MTPLQLAAVVQLFKTLSFWEFHHGDCVGADAQAVTQFKSIYSKPVISHPPINNALRAFVHKHYATVEVLEPKSYLERNRDIVNATDILIAAPDGPEKRRSGTWSTVRYARKRGKTIYIAWPDGSVTHEKGAETA
jgi:hypothetical protein